MESKSGELFLTRLNEDKFISGISMKDGSAFAYTTYILENHIEYLKEKVYRETVFHTTLS